MSQKDYEKRQTAIHMLRSGQSPAEIAVVKGSRTRFVKGQKDKPARRQNRYEQRVSICEWNRKKEEHQRILLPTNCTL